MNRWFLGAFSILFQVCAAYAQEATFGPEFNFTNENLIQAGRALGPSVVNSDANTAAQKAFLAEVRKKCPDCQAKRIQDKYRIDAFKVQTPEGWSFTIMLDPWVVEVTTSPMTAKEVARNAPRIQELIFNSATAVGLYPSQKTSGHLHIGISSAFQRDPHAVRNFIVDWVNHSLATAHAFHWSPANAAPMAAIYTTDSESLLHRFHKFLGEWDKEYREYLKFLGPETLLSNLFEGMRSEVYVKSYSGFVPFTKYQNLNVDHFEGFPKEEQTLELRGMREFQDAEEFARYTEIMQGRIDYLKNVEILIPVELETNQKNRYQIFDEYIYQAKGDVEYARRKSTIGTNIPIRISCEGLF
ncbi:hypothetical protein [Bdellovibrio sp. HCB2-146]|uniref:hypothetical protein n=1 Tax=Bdellovibrio sp. HCB2-146 TaxID=3394362 RepID=UPI0039BCC0B3